MLLVERGLVSLDDPVARYLPEFAGPDRAAVRVRDLLTHTSGLPACLPAFTHKISRNSGPSTPKSRKAAIVSETRL
jgi:CubicO group peptidase (beta-lactamase class C family)